MKLSRRVFAFTLTLVNFGVCTAEDGLLDNLPPLVSQRAVPGPNLIVNPGFDDSTSSISPWTGFYGLGLGDAVQIGKPGLNSNQALLLNGNNSQIPASAIWGVQQPIVLRAGLYKLDYSFKVTGKNLSTGNSYAITLGSSNLRGDVLFNKYFGGLQATNGWVAAKDYIDVQSQDLNTNLQISTTLDKGLKLFIDNVRVRAVSRDALTPQGSPVPLQNAGFESGTLAPWRKNGNINIRPKANAITGSFSVGSRNLGGDITQDVAFAPGTTYRAQLAYRVTAIDACYAPYVRFSLGRRVGVDDVGQGGTTEYVRLPVAHGGAQTYTTFVVGNGNTVAFKINAAVRQVAFDNCGDAPRVFVDDIGLQAVADSI